MNTIGWIEKHTNAAYLNYKHWLNYTTPQGGCCDSSMSNARKDWLSWERRLKEAKASA